MRTVGAIFAVAAYPLYVVTHINPLFYLLVTLGCVLLIYSDGRIRGKDVLGALMLGELSVFGYRSLYKPADLRIGFWLFFITLVICLVVRFFRWRRWI